MGSDKPVDAANLVLLIVLLVSLAGAIYFAMENLRLSRGDRRGAFRLAAFWFVMNVLIWAFGSEHIPAASEVGALFKAIAWGLLVGGMVWLVYVALEPHARRLWPNSLISWNRILAARFRDPMVGRDVLIGSVLGLSISLFGYAVDLLSLWLGDAAFEPRAQTVGGFPQGVLEVLVSVPRSISFYLFLPQVAVANSLVVMLLLVMLHLILRKQWAALTVLFVLFSTIGILGHPSQSQLSPLAGVLQGALMLFALVRFGLLALAFTILFYHLDQFCILTPDLSVWYSGRSLLLLGIFAALVIYGYIVSQGSPRLRNLDSDSV